MEIPRHLKHKPIVSIDYSEIDANAGDAKFISLGRATWNPEDVSAKVWRWSEDGKRWSRQSEELPLWRVLDLAILLISTIRKKPTSMEEKVVNEDNLAFLYSFLSDNMELYAPRLLKLSELLNGEYLRNYATVADSNAPNIFSYATSELSQDAILAWLIKWADDSYLATDEGLSNLGKSLVALLTGMSKEDIHKIDVGRQWENIDVWAEINDDAFLIIEDKIGTYVHDNQLSRYRKTVEDEYHNKRDKLFYAYVKTENEAGSIAKAVNELGYSVVDRGALLGILNYYYGSNPLVLDYRKHLQDIEDATNNYRSVSVDEWRWYEWQGFYRALEKCIDVESWSYVANPSGGFLGLWWHFVENDEVRMYLQFEQSKLCVKIEYNGEYNPSECRNRYHYKLLRVCEEMKLPIERPSRFGAGVYMTIGVIPKDFIFTSTIVDIDRVVLLVREYEKAVDSCMK
ncbi:MAG: PD-(D/E)XK nuclease family protein [Bacteroidales bacterium]|nr:PD-(D/E)XK nuclease family protein [Bacteroidales bacterium]